VNSPGKRPDCWEEIGGAEVAEVVQVCRLAEEEDISAGAANCILSYCKSPEEFFVHNGRIGRETICKRESDEGAEGGRAGAEVVGGRRKCYSG